MITGGIRSTANKAKHGKVSLAIDDLLFYCNTSGQGSHSTVTGTHMHHTSLTKNDRSESPAAAETQSIGKRIPVLDLIKWLAIATMVMDHSRAMWPSLQVLTIPGRLAFPLFCLVMACNVARQQRGSLNSPGNVRYLGSLLFFGVISQPMFYAVFGQDLNIFWLLSSALTIALAVHHRTPGALLLGAFGAALAIVFHDQLGYHAVGVLIPAVMVLALRSKGTAHWAWVAASCALCCLANMLVPEVWTVLLSGEIGAVFVAVAAFFAPAAGFWLVSTKLTLTIKPVGRWGYLFYPMHLGLLALLRDFSL